MADKEIWVEEVLFRGRPPSGPDSELPPRLHVVMGVQRLEEDLLNASNSRLVRQITDPLTMAQAQEAFGFTPAGLVEQINGQAFAEADRQVQIAAALSELAQDQKTEIEARGVTIDQLGEQADGLTARMGEMAAEHAAASEESQAQIEALTTDLAVARHDGAELAKQLTNAQQLCAAKDAEIAQLRAELDELKPQPAEDAGEAEA